MNRLALLMLLSVPVASVADNPVAPSYTLVVTEGETECIQMEDSRLKLYDMQCSQGPTRCGISASPGADASAAVLCVATALDTYPVDPARRNQWLCIYGEGSGTTTCRVYEQRLP